MRFVTNNWPAEHAAEYAGPQVAQAVLHVNPGLAGAHGYRLPAKWISADGRTLHLVFSGLRPWGRFVPYSASKAGVIQFTRSVALQYARQGIRANAVLPGLMNTPMIREPLKEAYGGGDVERMVAVRDAQCPMGFMGDAWDVARASLFLASDEARYVTGTELIVDGGITAKYA